MRPCSSWYSTTARRRSRWSSSGDVGSLASAWGRAWSSRAPSACTATGSRCSTPPTSCGCRSLTTASVVPGSGSAAGLVPAHHGPNDRSTRVRSPAGRTDVAQTGGRRAARRARRAPAGATHVCRDPGGHHRGFGVAAGHCRRGPGGDRAAADLAVRAGPAGRQPGRLLVAARGARAGGHDAARGRGRHHCGARPRRLRRRGPRADLGPARRLGPAGVEPRRSRRRGARGGRRAVGRGAVPGDRRHPGVARHVRHVGRRPRAGRAGDRPRAGMVRPPPRVRRVANRDAHRAARRAAPVMSRSSWTSSTRRSTRGDRRHEAATSVSGMRERERVLWQPPDDVLDSTRIGRYLRWLASYRGLSFSDYDSLWRWSVDDLDGFWRSVWDHFHLESATPVERALAGAEMPGAAWFPGATVNYAGHALRSEPAGPALVAWSQSRDPVELSMADLRDQVARCRAGLERLGVGAGDRVAAYLPNIPETVVTLLATASLGAIW